MTKFMRCVFLLFLYIQRFSNTLDIAKIVNGDDFIERLLSASLTKDRSFKSLIQIQNAAFRMACSRAPVTFELRNNLVNMLKVASTAGKKEKLNDLLGQILFISQKLESNEILDQIILKYNTLLSASTTSTSNILTDKVFGPVYENLLRLKPGVTLIFAVDTSGSMHDEIVESKQIAIDIINEPRLTDVDYILSPFNDPGTGPVTYRSATEKLQISNDISRLVAKGGGDCPEYAFRGMQDALDFGPEVGSTMLVFTDAGPKDGNDFNVQNLIDTASFDDIKVFFLIKEYSCDLKKETLKYYKVADETGGMVLTFRSGLSSNQDRGHQSMYSPLVKQSLRGTSLLKSKPAGKFAFIVQQYFYIDDGISFVTVLVVSSSGKPTSVALVDSAHHRYVGSTVTNSIVFVIENPIPGKWKISCPDKYSYTISVAFKSPIAIDVRYFYEVKPRSLIMSSRPMKDREQYMLVNIIGGHKFKLSSVVVTLVNSNGNLLKKLCYMVMEIKYSLKLKVTFVPPNIKYRVRVTGITSTGYAVERLTNQITRPALVIFKTISPADRFSARIGSNGNKFALLCYVNLRVTVGANIFVYAKLGSVTLEGRSGRVYFHTRFVLKILYNAPTYPKFQGRCDHVTIEVKYGGEITTHRLSILLL